MKMEIWGSPSKYGTPEQLDQTHRGLQITKPQGVEAQFLRQILETRIKRDLNNSQRDVIATFLTLSGLQSLV